MEQRTGIQTGLLFVITLVVVGSVMRMVGSFVLPLVIAVLLAFALYPLVTQLIRFRIPRILAILLVLMLFLAVGFLIGLIIYSSGQQMVKEFPAYQQRFSDILHNNPLVDRLSFLMGDTFSFGEEGESAFSVIGRYLLPTLRSSLLSISGGFLSFLSSFFMTMLYLLFLLLEAQYIRAKVIAAFDDVRAGKVIHITGQINEQIGHYVGLKLFTSGLTAIVVAIGFSIVGVDFAIIWAVLTFMFNFIPSIGSIIISLVSFLFIFVQFYPDPAPIFLASAVMGVSQIVIGNVLDPKLQGERLNLSPVVIIFSLLFWGWLWGIAGMFLAVPLTMVMKIICGLIPSLRPLSIMMESGKALCKQCDGKES